MDPLKWMVFLCFAASAHGQGIGDIIGCRLDLGFIMDESGSIGSQNFEIAKEFVANFSGLLDIGEKATRVGVVQFDSSASLEIKPNQYYNKQQLLNAIGDLPYSGGGTDIADGLQVAREQMFIESAGDRTTAPNLALLMTDGNSSPLSEIVEQANLLRATGTSIVVIGIGDGINPDTLEAIAGDPEMVFYVADFDSLYDDIMKIISKSCEASKFCAGGQFDGWNSSYPALQDCPKLSNPVVENSKYIKFYCSLNYSVIDIPNAADARFQVTFLFNDEPSPEVPPEVLQYPQDSVVLHERYLLGNMGKYISCQVNTWYITTQNMKSPPVVSRSYWAGIAFSHTNINIFEDDDEAKSIFLYSTLPVTCFDDADAVDGCELALDIWSNTTAVAVFQYVNGLARPCTYVFADGNWQYNESFAYVTGEPLQILAQRDPISGETRRDNIYVWARRIHEPKFDENGISYDHPFNGYFIGNLEVNVHDGDPCDCSSSGDPRITTFDDRYYTSAQVGTFTYVKSSSVRGFEVEVRHFPCSVGSTTCSIACGVAVKEGNGIHIISTCSEDGMVHILHCNESSSGQLTADAARQTYMISTPGGAQVKASLLNRGINLQITVPARDRGKTQGLCGTFDGNPDNDFQLKGGSMLTRSTDEFVNSWRTNGTVNLFTCGTVTETADACDSPGIGFPLFCCDVPIPPDGCYDRHCNRPKPPDFCLNITTSISSTDSTTQAVTQTPSTPPPSTPAPTSSSPSTPASSTPSPSTPSPTSPSTSSPSTPSPTSPSPSTSLPSTPAPTSPSPSTPSPTSPSPSTPSPTSPSPSTSLPSTPAPTTAAPTTAAPTTSAPTTHVPTTAAPTTAAPTTAAPTTEPPTEPPPPPVNPEDACSCHNVPLDNNNPVNISAICGFEALEHPLSGVGNPSDIVKAFIPPFLKGNAGARRRHRRSGLYSVEDDGGFSEIDYEYIFVYYEESYLGDEDSPPPTWEEWQDFNNLTKQIAEDHCSGYLLGSQSHQACDTSIVDAVNFDRIVQKCMDDIQRTGDLSWAEDKVFEYQSVCLRKIMNNTHVTDRENPLNDPNLKDKVDNYVVTICPANCSGVGQCMDGNCQCNQGYFGADCSMSQDTYPTLTRYQGPRICDIDEVDCRGVTLEAIDIVNSVVCQVKIQQQNGPGKTIQYAGQVRSKGVVWCPLPDLLTLDIGDITTETDPAYFYDIALSNDGVNFSPPLSDDRIVMDSLCMDCSSTLSCTQKAETCVIDALCYENGFVMDACRWCDSEKNDRDWTRGSSDGQPPEFESSPVLMKLPDEHLWIPLESSESNVTYILVSPTGRDDIIVHPEGMLECKPTPQVEPQLEIKIRLLAISGHGCVRHNDVEISLVNVICESMCANLNSKCTADEDKPPGQGHYLCSCKDGYEGDSCEVPPIGTWNDWTEFQRCSKDCDYGIRTRSRQCMRVPCDGYDEESMVCNDFSCPEKEDEMNEGVVMVVAHSGITKIAEIQGDIESLTSDIVHDFCIAHPEDCCNAVNLMLADGTDITEDFFSEVESRVANSYPRVESPDVHTKILSTIDVTSLAPMCISRSSSQRHLLATEDIRNIDKNLMETAIGENTHRYSQELSIEVRVGDDTEEADKEKSNILKFIVAPVAAVAGILLLVVVPLVAVLVSRRNKQREAQDAEGLLDNDKLNKPQPEYASNDYTEVKRANPKIDNHVLRADSQIYTNPSFHGNNMPIDPDRWSLRNGKDSDWDTTIPGSTIPVPRTPSKSNDALPDAKAKPFDIDETIAAMGQLSKRAPIEPEPKWKKQFIPHRFNPHQ